MERSTRSVSCFVQIQWLPTCKSVVSSDVGILIETDLWLSRCEMSRGWTQMKLIEVKLSSAVLSFIGDSWATAHFNRWIKSSLIQNDLYVRVSKTLIMQLFAEIWLFLSNNRNTVKRLSIKRVNFCQLSYEDLNWNWTLHFNSRSFLTCCY